MTIRRRTLRPLLPTLFVAWSAGCASGPEPAAADRIGFEEARRMFEARGVQPGEPLPPLTLVDLEGRAVDLASLRADRPLVLVTCSLTCNVARRRQPDVDALRRALDGQATVVVIYTIDAHPSGDPCPYTGSEWVPQDNVRDDVLVRQPTNLDERITVARLYRDRFTDGSTMLVDTMDDASWSALGQVPNLGLLIDRDGVVHLRQGWFDAAELEASTRTLLADPTTH